MSCNYAIWLPTHASPGDGPGFRLQLSGCHFRCVSSRIINGTTTSPAPWASRLRHLMPSENSLKVTGASGVGPAQCLLRRQEFLPVSSSAQSLKGQRTYKLGECCVGTKEPWAPVPYSPTLPTVPSAPYRRRRGEEGRSGLTEGWEHRVFSIWGLSWQEVTAHSREPQPSGLFSHSMSDIEQPGVQDGISSALLPASTE